MKVNKKPLNEIDLLRNRLNDDYNMGFLKNPTETYLNRLKNTIEEKLSGYFSRQLKKYTNYFQNNFRRNFISAKDGILKRNIGLRSFKLADLDNDFESAYSKANLLSLNLIKTQNDENMMKLKNRFLNWLTISDFDGDKAKLKEVTKIPKLTKRVRFILKDQSAKISGNMDKILADKYDAICFQWKTRNNDRVVGKPGGKYPKATNPAMHGDHWSRRDKYFYYRKNEYVKKGYLNLSKFKSAVEAIQDGVPSEPIGCQCYAKNYFDLADLPKELLSEKGLRHLGYI